MELKVCCLKVKKNIKFKLVVIDLQQMIEFILITIVLSKDPSNFEIRVPKKTSKKCIEDS